MIYAQPKCSGITGFDIISINFISLFYYGIVQVPQEINNQPETSGQLDGAHTTEQEF